MDAQIVLFIIGALLSIIGTFIIIAFNKLMEKIDKITVTLESHNNDLIKILSRNEVQSQFIDGHTDDIEELKRQITNIQINCATKNHRRKPIKHKTE